MCNSHGISVLNGIRKGEIHKIVQEPVFIVIIRLVVLNFKLVIENTFSYTLIFITKLIFSNTVFLTKMQFDVLNFQKKSARDCY